MTAYFPKGNWEETLYQRLNQLIDTFHASPNTPLHERAYVVFDFDNPSIYNDIEDHTTLYMTQQLAFRMTAEEFSSSLQAGPFDFNLPISPEFSSLTTLDFIQLLTTDYCQLYTQYLSPSTSSRPSLSLLQRSPLFQRFYFHMRVFYTAFNQRYTRLAGQAWPAYFYQGYSSTDLFTLTQQALKWGSQLPLTYTSLTAPLLPSSTQNFRPGFSQGLRLPLDILHLYQAFKAHQIEVYILSASPLPLVQAAVHYFGYPLATDHILAMKLQRDSTDHMQNRMAKGAFITQGKGKKEALDQLLKPLHRQKLPIAFFGDSMGDYNLLQLGPQMKTAVLFNRYLKDNTQAFAQEAVRTYQDPSAIYFLQGRNEQTGQLYPSQSSLGLDNTLHLFV